MFLILDSLLLMLMLTFQVWNFWKYRDTNGLAKKRIVFLISTIALIIHCIRLWMGVTTGAFLLLHIIALVFLFDITRLKSFWDWVRGK